ncbi:hypothetical protein COEU31_06540 [Coprococcus eutactus]|uniref:Uncharacterized protein n=1 Tax=Coprococcus eutactus TaxID=33043 RepID=A0AAI9K1I0_9FIRM|nr:hypothetical protein COEU31_06540 [Coprococcus eutactus]
MVQRAQLSSYMRQVRSSLTLKNKRKNNENLRVDFTVALGYSISVREDNGNIYYSLGGLEHV